MFTDNLQHEVNPNDIERTIASYMLGNKTEIVNLDEYIKDLKRNAKDGDKMTTGDKNANRRLLGSVPVELVNQIEEIDPDTFRDREKTREFFKTFAQFAAVDRKFI